MILSTYFLPLCSVGLKNKSLEGNTIYLLQNDNNKKSLYKVLLKGEDNEIETYMSNCENVKADVRYVELAKVGTTNF